MSQSLGEHEVEREALSRTTGQRGDSTSSQLQRTRERVVLPSEIASLPDLAGYLAFAGDHPIAKVEVKIIRFRKPNPRVRGEAVMLSHKILTRQDVNQAASYYEDGVDDYYAGEGEASAWQGKGADALGLTGAGGQHALQAAARRAGNAREALLPLVDARRLEGAHRHRPHLLRTQERLAPGAPRRRWAHRRGP